MIKKWVVDYPLTDKGKNHYEKRKVCVYLPLSYEYEEERKYPVLYVFDGQNIFYDKDASYGKSWGLGKYLDRTQTDLIVVAVECNRGKNNERLSEYSPFDFNDPTYGSFIGNGDKTMQWFIKSLKPKIDRKFRTISERDGTFIMGSSMGGLMALFACLKYNEIFSACAALSPSIELVPNDIKNFIRKAKIRYDTAIYIDYGTEEFRDIGNGIERLFADVTKLLIQKKVMLSSRIVPYGIHNEATWEKQLPFVISTLLYDP